MKLLIRQFSIPMIFPLIFLCIVFASTWISLTYIETQSKQNIHKSLDTVLKITEEALELWLSNRLDELTSIATDQQLLTLTTALIAEQSQQQNPLKHSTLQKLRDLMVSKMDQDDDHGFFVITPDRISLASMRDNNIGTENVINRKRKHYLDRAFLGESLFIPSVSAEIPLLSQSGQLRNKQPTLFIATPILNNHKKVIAVLTIRLNPLADFTRITQLGRIGSSGETYAFDKKGVLISQSRFTQHLRKSGTIGDDELGMLSIRVADPGGNTLKGYVPTLQMADRPLTLMATKAVSQNTDAYIEAYRDYRGVPVFGSWLWSNTFDIGLTTEIDAQEALQPYQTTRTVIMTVLIIIIGLIIGLVFIPLLFQERAKQALKQHTDSLEQTVQERTVELLAANEHLHMLCEIDPLTQIANRRLYEQTLSSAVAASKRASQAMSLMIIDIDYFKPFNDNYGHDQGDVALKAVAQAIDASVTRATDLAARYGGEEFVVLMPSTDNKGAIHLAKLIKDNVEKSAIEHQYSTVAVIVTVSIGIASLTGDSLNDTDLFKQADSALYQAKENGRNQISSYYSS